MELENKVALVTGGASGIGRGISLCLAQAGADVAVADMNRPGAEATAKEVAATGRKSVAFTIEVTKTSSIEEAVKQVLAAFGRIDILINGAGIVGAPGWQQREIPTELDWDLTYQVNVKGLVFVSRAVAEHMKPRRSGKIVNLASVAARIGRPPHPHYSSSKASVINWTQAHAGLLAPFSINVNAICPGLLWTPMWEILANRYINLDPAYKGKTPRAVFEEMVKQRIPMGREQTPEDIGNAAVFLCSDRARNITGQSINVDGGWFMN